jgi:hypothetical protein
MTNGQDQGAGGPPGFPPPPGGQPPGNPQQPGVPQQPGPGPGYPGQPGAQRGSGPGFCPACGSGEYTSPSFTWWGGVLGPKLLSHVTCNGCGTGFNSKTGKSNNTAIGIYLAVGTVAAIVIFWFLLPSLL